MINSEPSQACQCDDNSCDNERRHFISKSVAIAAGTVVAPGIFLHQVAQAKNAAEATTDKVRWGILVDTTKCADGCTDCVKACDERNGLTKENRPEIATHWIRKVTLRDKVTKKENSLPMMCQHCENPPCVDVCPTGASFKRPDGIVLVDKHICIGCRYCMMACPYKARSFVHEAITDQKAHAPRGKGTVEACNLCVDQVDQGGQPSCVTGCQHGAMLFGDLKDPESAISKKLKEINSIQLRADLSLNPGIRYHGL